MKKNSIRKLTIAGVLVAVAVVGSLIFHTGSWRKVLAGAAYGKCARRRSAGSVVRAQGMGFAAALIRKVLGLGSLLAFPGSMIGALLWRSGLQGLPEAAGCLRW